MKSIIWYTVLGGYPTQGGTVALLSEHTLQGLEIGAQAKVQQEWSCLVSAFKYRQDKPHTYDY